MVKAKSVCRMSSIAVLACTSICRSSQRRSANSDLLRPALVVSRYWFNVLGASPLVSCHGYWKRVGASKALLLSKWSQKLPRQRKPLIAQDDFGKIICVVRRNLCFLSVYMGNPRIEFLLANGADVNAKRSEGETALVGGI